MKKPEEVAKAGIKSLFNNCAECVPGFLNKLIVFLFPLIPHFVISAIYKRTKFFNQQYIPAEFSICNPEQHILPSDS